jgi:hypothetical protein
MQPLPATAQEDEATILRTVTSSLHPSQQAIWLYRWYIIRFFQAIYTQMGYKARDAGAWCDERPGHYAHHMIVLRTMDAGAWGYYNLAQCAYCLRRVWCKMGTLVSSTIGPIFLAVTIVCSLPVMTEAACHPIHRSHAVRLAFQRLHPCPSTHKTTGACHGYILDHTIPLCLGPAAGGIDSVANMAWQTIADAKVKDRIERQMCRQHPRPCIQ